MAMTCVRLLKRPPVLRGKVLLLDYSEVTFYICMPPATQSWGILFYPCPLYRSSVRLSFRPSVPLWVYIVIKEARRYKIFRKKLNINFSLQISLITLSSCYFIIWYKNNSKKSIRVGSSDFLKCSYH